MTLPLSATLIPLFAVLPASAGLLCGHWPQDRRQCLMCGHWPQEGRQCLMCGHWPQNRRQCLMCGHWPQDRRQGLMCGHWPHLRKEERSFCYHFSPFLRTKPPKACAIRSAQPVTVTKLRQCRGLSDETKEVCFSVSQTQSAVNDTRVPGCTSS